MLLYWLHATLPEKTVHAMSGSVESPEMVDRLAAAVNAHDLDGLVACFAGDYLNETPAHPLRGFRGTDQVRRNWAQLFAGIPDLTAQVLRFAAAGDTIWTEWEMAGTRRDGTAHLMRGVVIFGVAAGQAQWARFYLEPVEAATGDVDAAIRQAATGGPETGDRS